MYTQSGCKSGNCLRSHVNQTEVLLALAMSKNLAPLFIGTCNSS